MKRVFRSRQRHDLYAKYHDYDSEISDLLGECGFISVSSFLYPEVLIDQTENYFELYSGFKDFAWSDYDGMGATYPIAARHSFHTSEPDSEDYR